VRRAWLGAAVVAALFAAGCGESEQVVVYKQGKYQGKPDTRPWDNSPLALKQGGGGNWTKGDRASWDQAINSRAMAQNEHKRIYNQ
jgi:hypothetical protein